SLSYHFFFHRTRDHRNLHSFPTRRSSDLNLQSCQRTQPPATIARFPLARAIPAHASPQSIVRYSIATSHILPRSFLELCEPTNRSEEHTSELQSQSNLVCRLLLEKKNYKK